MTIEFRFDDGFAEIPVIAAGFSNLPDSGQTRHVDEQKEHGTVWSAGDTAAATDLVRTVTSDAPSVLIGVKNAEALIEAHG